MVERGVGDAAAKLWAVTESRVGGEGAVACGRDCRDGDRRRGRPGPAARGDGLNDARRDDGWFRIVPGILAAQTALQKDASIEIVWSVGWKLGGRAYCCARCRDRRFTSSPYTLGRGLCGGGGRSHVGVAGGCIAG